MIGRMGICSILTGRFTGVCDKKCRQFRTGAEIPAVTGGFPPLKRQRKFPRPPDHRGYVLGGLVTPPPPVPADPPYPPPPHKDVQDFVGEVSMSTLGANPAASTSQAMRDQRARHRAFLARPQAPLRLRLGGHGSATAAMPTSGSAPSTTRCSSSWGRACSTSCRHRRPVCRRPSGLA